MAALIGGYRDRSNIVKRGISAILSQTKANLGSTHEVEIRFDALIVELLQKFHSEWPRILALDWLATARPSR